MVVFTSSDMNIYALHASTGTLKWRYSPGCYLNKGPVIGPDGRIYVGSKIRQLYALSEKCPDLENCLVAALRRRASRT